MRRPCHVFINKAIQENCIRLFASVFGQEQYKLKPTSCVGSPQTMESVSDRISAEKASFQSNAESPYLKIVKDI